MLGTEVAHLTVEFSGPRERVRAVDDVSLIIAEGKTTCLVGESGSGKSTTALAIPSLLPQSAHVVGSVMFDGRDLLNDSAAGLDGLRGSEIGVVFQDSLAALNPTSPVGVQIAEVLRRHMSLSKADARQRAVELLAEVHIPDPKRRARDYPHQFSGGMRQRVMIASAVACRPRLLIADEPTTALDVTVQSQILELLRDLQREHGMALLLVTHDMGVVAEMAESVAVMYAGQIVESGRALDLLQSPSHRYTDALLRAAPKIRASGYARLPEIAGQPPAAVGTTTGCRFRDRCAFAQHDCGEADLPLVKFADGALSRCLHPPARNQAKAAADG